MARPVNRLSALFVRTAKEPGRYADGGNLYLSISPNGGRRWVFLFRWKGKPTEMGFGSAREVALARAREKATEARALLAEGLNPIEKREQQRAIPTFGEAADALIDSKEPGWRNTKHVAQWRMTLTEYAASLRSKSVDSIDTEDVLKVLKPIWQTKPETASRVRGRIEAVLDAARAQGHRSGENPARWRGHLDKVMPARRILSRGHHAAMPYADVPAFVELLRANPTTSNLALEFLILSAGRSGEIMGATWGEFDLQEKVWTIPPSRMKAKQQHQVPLTGRMLEILSRIDGTDRSSGAIVFPGARGNAPLSTMALAMALRRLGAAEFTVHGFRSSFRDWAGDLTSFPADLAEAALAHTIKSATVRAYRRTTALERRREMMAAWASYLQRPAGAVVISMQKAQSR